MHSGFCLDENGNDGICLDAVHVNSFKLCMATACIKLYAFMLVTVTLTNCQEQRRVVEKKKKRRLKNVFSLF